MNIAARFASLGIDNAPGQESARDTAQAMRRTANPDGVDFSHGDVGAFPPTPGALGAFSDAYEAGAKYAYSEYRGHAIIREPLAGKIADFTKAPIDPARELIVTPGTQAGLFLALSSLVAPGDKVVIVEPDYFANRKIVAYLGGEAVPVTLSYNVLGQAAELDLGQLEAALSGGANIILFSNPNNPTGALYTEGQIRSIVDLAERFGAFIVVDELYSRLIYPGNTITHLRACGVDPDRCITLLGPSKTESLSGFRTGVAVGAPSIIERMEKLLAIVSLRTAGYNQAVLDTWFAEPEGWLTRRIDEHRQIRDGLVEIFSAAGFLTRTTEGGSYIFPTLPPLRTSAAEFVATLRHQYGIVVTPGTEFSPHHASSIRLNFSQDHDNAIAAAHSIVTCAKDMQP
ncbi:pyridoxal phosphate-dependent aminotransferase [Nocardia carnea]|uniref:pyridoxal phosphate-dependent aminotransferase n=1 Tax=Nocardia carnea TaxID=37328 RepID=UPI0024560631|nr:pyridoxal phosphate-dependent aminotransferase [Nocardia carnea]